MPYPTETPLASNVGAGDAPSPSALRDAGSLRSMDSSTTFWIAMFAASCLGTNLGDFWVDALGPIGSFASLAIVCVVAIVGDRRSGGRTEAFYWVAIVALRAAATNGADFLTHDTGFAYSGTAIALAVAALATGLRTRLPHDQGRSPLIDGWYWLAMLIAGVFGTVAGDLASHIVGLYAAAAALTASLIIVLAMGRSLPGAVLGYWLAVLAERCAGTPVGDALASRHAIGLGVPVAMACTAAFFAGALIIRRASWHRWDRSSRRA